MARPRSDISDRILESAAEAFQRDGVDSASLRRIADAAGTGIGMVHYHFGGKEELFLAVVEEAYVRVLADLERILRSGATWEAKTGALFERVGGMDDHESRVFRIIVREMLTSTERRRTLLSRFTSGHIPLVLAHVLEGQRSGSIAPDLHPLAALAATFSLAVAPQLVLRLARDSAPAWLPLPDGVTTARAMLDILLRGIGRRVSA